MTSSSLPSLWMMKKVSSSLSQSVLSSLSLILPLRNSSSRSFNSSASPSSSFTFTPPPFLSKLSAYSSPFSSSSISSSSSPTPPLSNPSPSSRLSSVSSTLISDHRTSITQKLWTWRREQEEKLFSWEKKWEKNPKLLNQNEETESHKDNPNMFPSPIPIPPPSKTFLTPHDSLLIFPLPFLSDLSLYESYVRFDGGVRFEKLLEDLDSYAANVCWSHIQQGMVIQRRRGESVVSIKELSIVTAACDSITMSRRFPMDKNSIMRGRVTWVGKSSLECYIELLVDNGDHSNPHKEEKICEAYFVMAVRKGNSSYHVLPFSPSHLTSEEIKHFKLGELNAQRRKEESSNSLSIKAPTSEEIELIHKFMIRENGMGAVAAGKEGGSPHTLSSTFAALAQQAQSHSPLSPLSLSPSLPLSLPMSSTHLSTTLMTQVQDRNVNGKVFGGFLMRNSYELARSTAYLFCGPSSHPYFYAVDAIQFLRPVSIGTLIEFQSKIVFSSGYPDRTFTLKVDALVTDLNSGESFLSNVFFYTFKCDSVPVRRIVPNTYREAVEYLEGKRRREKLLAIRYQALVQEEGLNH